MSVANILGADGKISSAYLPTPAPPTGFVTNPMTANLLGAGFAMEDVTNIRTSTIESRPAPFPNFVEFLSDVEVATGKQLRSEVVRTDTLEALTGVIIEATDPLEVAESLTLKGTGGISSVKFADLSGNQSASIGGFPTGTIDIVTGASETVRLTAAQNPTLEFDADGVPAEPGLITYDGASKKFILDHSTQIRDPSITPRIFLISDASGFATNGELVYDASSQRMNVTRDFEVRGTDGAVTAGLRIGPAVNPVTLTYTQATSTLSTDKQVQFNSFCPRTAVPPTIGDSLTRKAYVDTKVAFKSTREFYVSKQGSDIDGNGSASVPFLTIQKAITEAEALGLSATNQAVIIIAAGEYTENLVFNTGYISLVSYNPNSSVRGPTTINGIIDILCTGADDVQFKQVNFQNLRTNGNIFDGSTASHNISFINCNMNFITTQSLRVQNTAPQVSVYMKDCVVTSSGNAPPLIFNQGSIFITNCQVSVSSARSCLSVSGVAQVIYANFNNFENSSSLGTLDPIVSITSSATAPHTFGGNSFFYNSPSIKTSLLSSGILFDGGASNQTVVAIGNTFSLNGTSHPSQHTIMKNPMMAGTATCIFGGNLALLGTNKIETSVIRVAATVVS